ncbi:M15 family metallopeptidase [Bacillus sp. OAE603]|uniref:M15 family metallopeptidase n=1 Tax=Gottfriedia sp. OAE603 TaxID=2663872 RepID=UPI00178C13A5
MRYLFTSIVVFSLFFVSACTKEKPISHSQLQKKSQNQKTHENPQSSQKDLHNIEKMNVSNNRNAVKTVAQPAAVNVLVNKKYFLPKNYVPKDLVYPTVSFIFKEKIEKRKMRKEAALALNKLFTGAKKDNIYLSGVSAYRSYVTQKAVFNRYVKEDGYANARKYCALPGSSEHQTGLAIDVSSSTGKCAAQSCFANTKEAKWLQSKSTNYGFIIRYPKGKESITGYKYEPWHIRYVGVPLAKQMKKRNITLEEYYNVYPVSK